MQENLKITQWRKHLPNMINKFYVVDGVEIMFVKFLNLEALEKIRLETTVRWYEVPYDQMPDVLAKWIPVEGNSGKPTYDHRYAEMGVVPPRDNNLPVAANLNDPKDREILLNTLFVDFIQNSINKSKVLEDKLEKSMINLKDPKNGTLGSAAIEQSKQMTNAVEASIKITKTNLETFIAAYRIFGDKTPPTDVKTNNDNS